MPITFPPQVTAATATKRLLTARELPCSDGEPMDTPTRRRKLWSRPSRKRLTLTPKRLALQLERHAQIQKRFVPKG